MPAPICVKCQVEMRCQHNDHLVNDVRASGFPPTYWLGDLFRCPTCDTEIVVAFGREIENVKILRFRKLDSLAFADSPEQREQYADQFEKRSDSIDA